MRVRVLPAIRQKYLDTVTHTALSVVDGLLRGFEIVLICNNANAPFALVPRLRGAKVVLNVDGLEWQRDKWNRLGRWYYQACAWLAPKLPIVLVSDARVRGPQLDVAGPWPDGRDEALEVIIGQVVHGELGRGSRDLV